MGVQNQFVEVKPVMQVNVPKTLLQIGDGCMAKFSCKEFASFSSVRSAIYQLRRKGEDFDVVPLENGASFIVTRGVALPANVLAADL